MVHHSLTSDGATVSWAAIEKYHRETNGWRDIGYHAGIEIVTADEGLKAYRFQALVGRAPDEMAAACPQGRMNELALHVCVVGNFDVVTPTAEMYAVLARRVILPWRRMFGISIENIVRHHDFNAAKSCPGAKFSIETVRRMAT
jgi:hypothetical protein